MEEGDVTEEDEDDEDGICFATLENRFENKETVCNWVNYKSVMPSMICKKMVEVLFALAK